MSNALPASLLIFKKCLKLKEMFIPLGTDVLDPLLKITQGFGCKRIAFFPPLLLHGDQARGLEDIEMLENALACDWVFL
jgi:hypothetical protein